GVVHKRIRSRRRPGPIGKDRWVPAFAGTRVWGRARGDPHMVGNTKLLMLVGAATPPGRLAAAVNFAAESAATLADDIAIDVLNLADTPVDICDGRSLDAYSATTRDAVSR